MRYEVRLMEKYAEGKAEGLAEGKAEGLAEGKAEGRSEERDATERRNKGLVAALRDAGRLDELPGALEDRSVYDRLLGEFGISPDDEEAQEG